MLKTFGVLDLSLEEVDKVNHNFKINCLVIMFPQHYEAEKCALPPGSKRKELAEFPTVTKPRMLAINVIKNGTIFLGVILVVVITYHSYYTLESPVIFKRVNMGMSKLDLLWQYPHDKNRTKTSEILNNLSLNISHRSDSQCDIDLNSRFDCAFNEVVDMMKCQARGCCWNPAANAGSPHCFLPSNYPSYHIDYLSPTSTGYTASLSRSKKTLFPNDIMTLQLNVMYETSGRLHFTLKDPRSKRYEVPIDVPNITEKASTQLYTVRFSSRPFGIIVQRKSNGLVLLNTTVGPLFYADQFLQISTSLASKYISGLGEHMTNLILDLNWTQLTHWNRDQGPH
ncbi:lysosomal alpha-glucosidase-like, partial [Rhincodon typus]|uniref:lysosomal alpha-glucosidase-like n=1 Tax=Rhincodon typus TaxID=259920 RepID=UPI00202F609E